MYVAVTIFYAIAALVTGGWLLATLAHVPLAAIYGPAMAALVVTGSALGLYRRRRRRQRRRRSHDRMVAWQRRR